MFDTKNSTKESLNSETQVELPANTFFYKVLDKVISVLVQDALQHYRKNLEEYQHFATALNDNINNEIDKYQQRKKLILALMGAYNLNYAAIPEDMHGYIIDYIVHRMKHLCAQLDSCDGGNNDDHKQQTQEG